MGRLGVSRRAQRGGDPAARAHHRRGGDLRCLVHQPSVSGEDVALRGGPTYGRAGGDGTRPAGLRIARRSSPPATLTRFPRGRRHTAALKRPNPGACAPRAGGSGEVAVTLRPRPLVATAFSCRPYSTYPAADLLQTRCFIAAPTLMHLPAKALHPPWRQDRRTRPRRDVVIVSIWDPRRSTTRVFESPHAMPRG